MVRNDDFYLRRWVEYYGKELGKENLYVWFDGTDQVIPSFCEGIHTEKKEKVKGNVVESDKGRIDFRHTRLWSHVASTAYRRCAKFCIVEQTILVSVVFVFLAHLYLYNKNIAGFLASVG